MSKLTTRITALILEGHTDQHIARVLICHRATVNAVRRHMRSSGRYAPERLTAEAVPTGRALTALCQRQPTSEAQAAQRRADLLADLGATKSTRRST